MNMIFSTLSSHFSPGIFSWEQLFGERALGRSFLWCSPHPLVLLAKKLVEIKETFPFTAENTTWLKSSDFFGNMFRTVISAPWSTE
jgi:hypothetical protein